MDYLQYPQRRLFELYGDRGTLSYDFMTGEIRCYPQGADHRFEKFDVKPLPQRIDDLYRAQRDDVLERMAKGHDALVQGCDALACVVVAETMVRSARSGCAVDVPAII